MVQSSLTAWLKTPASGKSHPEQGQDVDGREKGSRSETQGYLPTPPSSSINDGPYEDANPQEQPKEPAPSPRMSPLARKQPSLPPNVQLRPCTRSDIQAFKRLNSLLLPIPYPDLFYRETLQDPTISNLTLLADWHDDPSSRLDPQARGKLIGAIRCRLLVHEPNTKIGLHASSNPSEKPMLYLSTLVLLSPYRGHGIAAEMLRLLTARAIEAHGIGSIGAHVWSENAEGLEWYAKRGFKEVRREEGYYRKLKPSTAVVVRRSVKVGDLLQDGEGRG